MAVTRFVWSLAALLVVSSIVNCLLTEEAVVKKLELKEPRVPSRAAHVNLPDVAGGEGSYASRCYTSKGASRCYASRKGSCSDANHGECYQLAKCPVYGRPAPCCCLSYHYYYKPIYYWQYVNGRWIKWKVIGRPAFLVGRCMQGEYNTPCCHRLSRNRCRNRYQYVRFQVYRWPWFVKWVWRRVGHYCYCAMPYLKSVVKVQK